MTEKDIITNWYYFCSIAKQLQNTNQFVDHSINSINEIINGKTYSNEFAKILMLSAAEFETVAKSLCSESGMTLPEKTNIVSITKNVLSAYPQIGFTEIHTPYQMIQPLKNWTTIRTLNAEGKQVEKVSGINWWEAHNEVKHSRFDRFIQANLENCVYSLASLLVLELYLSQKVLGNLNAISTIACEYFEFEYGLAYYTINPGRKLPDFRD